jgi:hypothetical protein
LDPVEFVGGEPAGREFRLQSIGGSDVSRITSAPLWQPTASGLCDLPGDGCQHLPVGGSAAAAFDVRDIWSSADRGAFTGGYAAVVEAHGVAFLILTPA